LLLKPEPHEEQELVQQFAEPDLIAPLTTPQPEIDLEPMLEPIVLKSRPLPPVNELPADSPMISKPSPKIPAQEASQEKPNPVVVPTNEIPLIKLKL